MSKQSRWGAVRKGLGRDAHSAEIARVKAVSLWRCANLCCLSAMKIVRACQSAPIEFVLALANPLRGWAD